MLKLKYLSRLILFLALVGMLAGCLGPKSPAEVTKAFWQAVIKHDADDVVKYSTLTNVRDYNGFGMDWKGFTPSWGKIVIDGEHARVESSFKGLAGNTTHRRQCTTYLVRQNGVWLVDYQHTATDLRGGALGQLFGQLNAMGKTLTNNLNNTAKQLDAEMARLGQRLQVMADDFTSKTQAMIDKHARELQSIMRKLQESINRALQDNNNHLNDHDQQVMVKVAAGLDNSGSLLAHPNPKTLSACNHDMGMAKQQLASIDGDISDDYREQWQALSKKYETVMQQMLNELDDATKSGSSKAQ